MSLTWWIYLGSIGNNAGGMGALGFLMFVVSMISTIVIWVVRSPGRGESATDQEKKTEDLYVLGVATRVRRVALPLCVLLWLVATLAPDRQTALAVAAAQIGERVATSDVASEGALAVRKWISRQLEDK